MEQKVVFAKNKGKDLIVLIENGGYDKLFILVDENTANFCLPLLKGCSFLSACQIITIGATDTHKDINSLTDVWSKLGEGGATRHSLLINVGGGMVTDLGGFAASTFKRGIDFVNIPTTLLAMVDAAVGGKTGINFNGLKNEIGVFNEARFVYVDTQFLQTLDENNLKSGYAEMLKHALLKDERMWANHLNFDLSSPDYSLLQHMVEESIALKQQVVMSDPHEKGLRKSLNLGHTFGHAFESLALAKERPILHGYAVAYGLVAELYLSTVLLGFPVQKMRQTFNYVYENYGRFDFNCNDYDVLIDYMKHDKKNEGENINFSLLDDIGQIHLDCHVDNHLLNEAFDFLREG